MTWCFWKLDGYFLIEKGVNFVFLLLNLDFLHATCLALPRWGPSGGSDVSVWLWTSVWVNGWKILVQFTSPFPCEFQLSMVCLWAGSQIIPLHNIYVAITLPVTERNYNLCCSWHILCLRIIVIAIACVMVEESSVARIMFCITSLCCPPSNFVEPSL